MSYSLASAASFAGSGEPVGEASISSASRAMSLSNLPGEVSTSILAGSGRSFAQPWITPRGMTEHFASLVLVPCDR